MGGGGEGVTNSITKIQLWNQTLRSRTCQISFPFIVVHQPSDDQAIYSNKLTQGGGGRGGGGVYEFYNQNPIMESNSPFSHLPNLIPLYSCPSTLGRPSYLQ